MVACMRARSHTREAARNNRYDDFEKNIHTPKITGPSNDSDFTLMFAAVDRQVIPAPAVDTESEVRA